MDAMHWSQEQNALTPPRQLLLAIGDPPAASQILPEPFLDLVRNFLNVKSNRGSSFHLLQPGYEPSIPGRCKRRGMCYQQWYRLQRRKSRIIKCFQVYPHFIKHFSYKTSSQIDTSEDSPRTCRYVGHSLVSRGVIV